MKKCASGTVFPKIDLEGIEGVLLDLDDTLYSYTECHENAVLKTYEKARESIEIGYENFVEAYMTARKRVNADLKGQGSSHSRLLYFQKMSENLNGKTDIGLCIKLHRTYWEGFFEKMELLEGALLFLEKCKESKVRTCIVTDLTAKIQMEKVVNLGIESYIDFIVSSEESGVEKPHPYIFKLASEKLGIDCGKLLMVGDNIDRDILGAKLLGMKCVHVAT